MKKVLNLFMPKFVNAIISVYGGLLLCSINVSAANVTDQIFSKVTDPSYWSERLGVSWSGVSLAECVTRCVVTYPDQCLSFMYNSNTRLCTPASTPDTSGALAPNSTEGDLYTPRAPEATNTTCDTSDGFTYVTSGTLSACILVSEFVLNYAGATVYCSGLGAHLFIGKTLDKLELLPPGESFMIGLNDIETEDVFRWVDTNEEMSQELRNVFFMDREPNNLHGNEDCIAYKAGGIEPTGNDFDCNLAFFRFVCER